MGWTKSMVLNPQIENKVYEYAEIITSSYLGHCLEEIVEGIPHQGGLYNEMGY